MYACPALLTLWLTDMRGRQQAAIAERETALLALWRLLPWLANATVGQTDDRATPAHMLEAVVECLFLMKIDGFELSDALHRTVVCNEDGEEVDDDDNDDDNDDEEEDDSDGNWNRDYWGRRKALGPRIAANVVRLFNTQLVSLVASPPGSLVQHHCALWHTRGRAYVCVCVCVCVCVVCVCACVSASVY
jgi:hypothetical protein